MMFPTLISLALAAVPLIAAAQDTVHGVVLFSRHGDRTWKGAPPTRLTSLGAQQLFSSGTYLRSRYLSNTSANYIAGISESYKPSQFYASVPDEPLLVSAGQVLLQGLYPPSENLTTEVLATGATVTAPLQGYQYAALHTIPGDTPDSMWLKGDDACPAHDLASQNSMSEDLANAATVPGRNDFYRSFYDKIFQGVLPLKNLTYENAYNIYDYINVGMVHNTTIRSSVSNADLDRLRILADAHESMQNQSLDPTDPRTVSGRTLAGKIMTQLTKVIDSSGTKGKLSLLLGSYDTFLSFFALTGLPNVSDNFKGLPDYGSAMMFELISFNTTTTEFPSESELFVRFIFRNGTDSSSTPTEYPLFGVARENAVMPWTQFKDNMQRIDLSTLPEWCGFCKSDQDYCMLFNNDTDVSLNIQSGWKGKIKPNVAGAIGAVSAFAFMGLLWVACAMLGVCRGKKIMFWKAKNIDEESIASSKS